MTRHKWCPRFLTQHLRSGGVPPRGKRWCSGGEAGQRVHPDELALKVRLAFASEMISERIGKAEVNRASREKVRY
jgi:hypothetical protein